MRGLDLKPHSLLNDTQAEMAQQLQALAALPENAG